MSRPIWIEIRATFPEPPQDWSLAADTFDRHGCPGSIIEGLSIAGYMADVPEANAQSDRLKADLECQGAQVAIGKIEEEDWSEIWRIHFKPRRVGERFVIRPTWEEAELKPGDIEIVLDPGQAFGTGDHQTTRLCLAELERLAPCDGKSLADIGCGSGVLAIGAAKLGAKVVLASDLDPLSIGVTKENMATNGVEFPIAVAAGFDGLQGEQVDIALSNIISATLIRTASDAARHVRSGGHWIVSGIIEGNWPDVLAAAERVGFRLEHKTTEDEWVGATFVR